MLFIYVFLGWHRRLNDKAGRADLGVYPLVTLLREEAAAVEMQMHLVSENLLNKRNKTKYARLHGRLFELWERYEDGDLSTEEF